MLYGFVPCDDECELLSAGFDPVLSLHVRHELCAVTIDGQDDVPWTKVTLGGFAAWCYLQVAFIHTHTHMHTIHTQPRGKEKKRVVITAVKMPVRKEEKKKGGKSIRLRVSAQRPNSTKAAVI